MTGGRDRFGQGDLFASPGIRAAGPRRGAPSDPGEEPHATRASPEETGFVTRPLVPEIPGDLFADASPRGAPTVPSGTARPGGATSGPTRGNPRPAPRPAPHGPATERQIGYARDIAEALRIPLPERRDAEAIGLYIAENRLALRAARGG